MKVQKIDKSWKELYEKHWIDKDKILDYAKKLYTEDRESWVYPDEIWLYLQRISYKFLELHRDIFINVENNDWWETFYQIFLDKSTVIKGPETLSFYYNYTIEQFWSERLSYESYFNWIEHYIRKTVLLLEFLDFNNK